MLFSFYKHHTSAYYENIPLYHYRPEGIHARPAGLLAKKAAAYNSRITITKNGKEVDAKRIMGIMSLGVKTDHVVTVKAEGEDEEAAVTALEAFFQETL